MIVLPIVTCGFFLFKSFLSFIFTYFIFWKKNLIIINIIVRFRINNTVITALVFNSIGHFLNIQLETVLSHQKKEEEEKELTMTDHRMVPNVFDVSSGHCSLNHKKKTFRSRKVITTFVSFVNRTRVNVLFRKIIVFFDEHKNIPNTLTIYSKLWSHKTCVWQILR